MEAERACPLRSRSGRPAPRRAPPAVRRAPGAPPRARAPSDHRLRARDARHRAARRSPPRDRRAVPRRGVCWRPPGRTSRRHAESRPDSGTSRRRVSSRLAEWIRSRAARWPGKRTSSTRDSTRRRIGATVSASVIRLAASRPATAHAVVASTRRASAGEEREVDPHRRRDEDARGEPAPHHPAQVEEIQLGHGVGEQHAAEPERQQVDDDRHAQGDPTDVRGDEQPARDGERAQAREHHPGLPAGQRVGAAPGGERVVDGEDGDGHVRHGREQLPRRAVSARPGGAPGRRRSSRSPRASLAGACGVAGAPRAW